MCHAQVVIGALAQFGKFGEDTSSIAEISHQAICCPVLQLWNISTARDIMHPYM